MIDRFFAWIASRQPLWWIGYCIATLTALAFVDAVLIGKY